MTSPPTWYVTTSPDNTRPQKRGGLAVFTKSTVKGSSLFWFLPYSLLSGPFHLGLNAANISWILIMQSSTLTALHRHDPQSSSSFPPASAPQPNCWCRQYIQWCVCEAGLVGDQLLRLWKLWEISLYELDTFFLPAQLWLDSFYLDENLVWPSRKKKHHHPPYDLSFFGLDESRSAEQVVITSRQLLSFFLFLFTR